MRSTDIDFGVIADVLFAGNSSFDPQESKNARHLEYLVNGEAFIRVGHESCNKYILKLKIDRTPPPLTISFRGASIEAGGRTVKTTVRIAEPAFYKTAKEYRWAIRNNAPDRIVKERNQHGTVLLGNAFTAADVHFHLIQPSREDKLHSLFHICAFALDD